MKSAQMPERLLKENDIKAALSEEYDRIKPTAINALLKGERMEYMLLKNGLKVVRVRREEVKNK